MLNWSYDYIYVHVVIPTYTNYLAIIRSVNRGGGIFMKIPL